MAWNSSSRTWRNAPDRMPGCRERGLPYCFCGVPTMTALSCEVMVESRAYVELV